MLADKGISAEVLKLFRRILRMEFQLPFPALVHHLESYITAKRDTDVGEANSLGKLLRCLECCGSPILVLFFRVEHWANGALLACRAVGAIFVRIAHLSYRWHSNTSFINFLLNNFIIC